tara:strand:+ start:2595 stop:2801 length:207 start_codon:yes stop_codon:yes gene_type:complete
MNREQMANILSEDYSDKVVRSGGNYQDAFNHYYARCMKREEADLASQIKTGALIDSGVETYVVFNESL